MNIAIFGEKDEFLNFDYNISKFNKIHNKTISAKFYKEKQTFLQEIEKLNIYTIFLVHSKNYEDIFEFAKYLKKERPKLNLIFCSKTSKWAVAGYKIDISYYICLPVSYEEFEFAIKKCTKNQNEFVTINSNWQKIPIKLQNIHFVEKQGHNVIIHTTEKIFSTRSTFKKFAQNFKDKKNFSNCIRGTIVNFDWVDDIKLQNFLMKNGEKIPIRRKDRTKIRELFFNYKLDKTSK